MPNATNAILKSVHVQNFKCLGDVRVDLEPLTVIIGKNDTGKSSFLEAIGLLASHGPSMEHARKGLFGFASLNDEALRKRGSSDPITITGEHTNGASNRLILPIPQRAPQTPKEDWSLLKGVQPPYRFDLAKLRAPAQIGPLKKNPLPPDGEALAAAVDRLPFKRFTQVQNELISRIPLIRELRCEPSEHHGQKEISFDVEGAGIVSARQMSDGVMLVLAILTVLYDENAPCLIMLEEPETGVHPKQLERLVEAFKSLVSQGIQILVTTHSPYLLDFVPKESVRVFARDDRGEVTVKPLTKVEEIADMVSRGFTLGEAWYNSDEDSIIRGTENARSTTQ